MTFTQWTPEQASEWRWRLLSRVRFHRRQAERAKRDLERFEADCARHGIRLIREPMRVQEDRRGRSDPQHR